jgi:membrane protease YdiL (CAAX protease family)
MDEVPILQAAINLAVIMASAAALGLVTSKLLRGQVLVPYTPRLPNDPGGILSPLVRGHREATEEWPARDQPDAVEVAEVAPAKAARMNRFVGDIALGIVGFLVMFLPVLGLQAILVKLVMEYQHRLIDDVLADRSIGQFMVAMLAAVIIAPVLEELIFRNFLQGGMEVLERYLITDENWSYGTVPIIGSSLLFAGVHWGQGPAAVPLFFFALMLGYLYYQTHRVLPVIVAHAALNLFSMIQLGFYVFVSNP